VPAFGDLVFVVHLSYQVINRVTKVEVLAIFSNAGGFLKPDQVLAKLQSQLDRRSLYSYLGRLRRQGLLERVARLRRGELAYRLTDRGRQRLAYLREHPRQGESKTC
jgi:Fe2+ or Zn2+ uptake regulation protein